MVLNACRWMAASELVVEAGYRTDLGIPEALRILVLDGGAEVYK